MRRPSLPALSLVAAASILAALGGPQASASERRSCEPRVYAHVTYAGPVYRGYFYAPRGYAFRGPRWDFSAAYYNSRYLAYAPTYGYAFRSRVYGNYYVAPHEVWRWRRR